MSRSHHPAITVLLHPGDPPRSSAPPPGAPLAAAPPPAFPPGANPPPPASAPPASASPISAPPGATQGDAAAKAAALLRRHNVRVLGEHGPAIMLGHGYAGSQASWTWVAPLLAENARVILFDNAGASFTESQHYDFEKYGSLAGYAQDVIAMLEALAPGPVTFAGHSMSAMVGLLAAEARPDLIDSLVMLCPAARYVDDQGYRGAFTQLEADALLALIAADFPCWIALNAATILGADCSPQVLEAFTALLGGNDPAIAAHAARVVYLSDHRAALSECRQPVLVMQTARDAIIPFETGLWVHRHLQRSRFVRLQATGHFPHMSAPEETAREIRAFLHASRWC